MIVEAAEQDFKTITELGLEYDNNFNNHYNLDLFHDDHHKLYVYKQDDVVLGFCMIEDTLDEASLLLIYVNKKYRNKHIATKLINYCFSHLDNSVRRVLLEVSINNTVAISLYKKMGFEKINIRRKYYSDGSDAIIMERIINNG